jgi:hypothetical protein
LRVEGTRVRRRRAGGRTRGARRNYKIIALGPGNATKPGWLCLRARKHYKVIALGPGNTKKTGFYQGIVGVGVAKQRQNRQQHLRDGQRRGPGQGFMFRAMVQGSWFRVQGVGVRVQDEGVVVCNMGCVVWGKGWG